MITPGTGPAWRRPAPSRKENVMITPGTGRARRRPARRWTRASVAAATTVGLCATLVTIGATSAAYTDRATARTDEIAASVTPVTPPAVTGLALGARMVDTGVGLSAAGDVYVWGLGMYGINGTSSSPVNQGVTKVPGLPKISSVSTGIYSLNALATDGTVWGWGDCSQAEGTDRYAAFDGLGCGVGGYGSPSVPAMQLRIGARATNAGAPVLDNVVAISSTEYAGAALRSDCTVYAWGAQVAGAPQYAYGGNGSALGATRVQGLPDPTTVPGACPVSIAGGYDTFWVVLENGDVYYFGGYSNGLVHGNPQVTADQVATGSSMAARKMTSLSTWFRSNVAAGDPYVVQVHGGIRMGGALLSDGTVLSWSNQNATRTGRQGAGADYRTPALVPGLSGVTSMKFGFTGATFLTSSGELWCYGASDDSARCVGDARRLAGDAGPTGTKVTQFGVGQGYMIWQLSNGQFWGQGYNPRGAIGSPVGVSLSSPRQVTWGTGTELSVIQR
ncbi:hypothetical protein [Cellulomonas hominis]